MPRWGIIGRMAWPGCAPWVQAVALALLLVAAQGRPAGAEALSAPQVVGGTELPAPAPAQPIALKVAVGATVDIRLEANATTGYSWAIDPAASKDLDRLAAAGDSYEMAAPEGAAAAAGEGAPPGVGAPPMAGAPGVQVFHFVGAAPGQAHVVFVYRRPWAPAAVEKMAEAIITVE